MARNLLKVSILYRVLKRKKYLRKDYFAFLAHFVEKKDNGKTVSDVPVVCDFPSVFPKDLTEEMKATISEEVGKALEASLPQFIDRLQTTLLSVMDDKMNE